MIDYICIAMLKFVRGQVLQMDDADKCLRRLMKYPPVENIRDLLTLAINERMNFDKKLSSDKTILNPLTKPADSSSNPKKAAPLGNSSFGFPSNFMESSISVNTTFSPLQKQESPVKKETQPKKEAPEDSDPLNVLGNSYKAQNMYPSQAQAQSNSLFSNSQASAKGLGSAGSTPSESKPNVPADDQTLKETMKDIQKVINKLEHEFFL
jgi:hypothetical protein